jgi:hypothetical protein
MEELVLSLLKNFAFAAVVSRRHFNARHRDLILLDRKL